MKRLTDLPTLRVSYDRPLSATYGKKRLRGCKGDTVATLLYANGIRIFSRSLKYHRPRGLYSLDGECANAMMEIDGRPNVHSECTLAEDGMVVNPQNVVGTPEKDLMCFMDALGWAMPAGFYYDMFHRPQAVWPLAARTMRKAAGLGRLNPDSRFNGRHEELFVSADVCVIGGGPAGMSAALSASESGLRVVLLEKRPWLGGSFDCRTVPDDSGVPLFERARRLEKRVAETGNIRVFRRTAAAGVYGRYQVAAVQSGGEGEAYDTRYVEIDARALISAAGCIERPLLFANNDRPGVMNISCGRRLAATWGVLPGERAVFGVGCDAGIEAAADLHDMGLKIECVADSRLGFDDDTLEQSLKKRGIPLLRGWIAAEALGFSKVAGVVLADMKGVRREKIDCDLLIASSGPTPVNGPLLLAGAEQRYDRRTGFFLPKNTPPGLFSAGSATGLFHFGAVEVSGKLAGFRAAGFCGVSADKEIERSVEELERSPGAVRGNGTIKAPGPGKRMFVCFDEDVTLKNVDQAIAKGFDAPELIKRFTAAGTGPGQGGIPGHNLALYAGWKTGANSKSPVPTKVRPPLFPASIGAYAGYGSRTVKRSPINASSKAKSGEEKRLSVWSRQKGAWDAKAGDEILNVRENAGMADISGGGKFRVHGPDALKALQRIYVGDMASIGEGMSKYSAMCNDDGCLVDHGFAIKLGEHDYYVTTAPSRAASTAEWIRYHARFEDWRFHVVDLTDAFGAINITGPKAPEILGRIFRADFSDEAFSAGGYREFSVEQTIPVRAFRTRCAGELSYELHVPASWAQAFWEILRDAGKPFGIAEFGEDTMDLLRLERGHVAMERESEQRTTLHDLGLGRLWDRNKRDSNTVGAFALRRTESQPGRLKRVGFETEPGTGRPAREGALVADDEIRGYVCSSRYSFALEKFIGVALVEEKLASVGARLSIFEEGCKGRSICAVVVPMPFYGGIE